MSLLAGKTIVVTRPQGQEASLVDSLKKEGAEVVPCPLILISPCYNPQELRSALERISGFDWVCFTSANGVQLVLEFAEKEKLLSGFNHARMACIGEATQKTLESLGFRASLVPDVYQAEGLVQSFLKQGVQGKKILLLRAKGSREILRTELEAGGAEVEEIYIYEAFPDAAGIGKLKEIISHGKVDCITFTSSSTVHAFEAISGEPQWKKISSKVALASIGPITSDSLKTLGLSPNIEAKKFTSQGLVQAITAFYAK